LAYFSSLHRTCYHFLCAPYRQNPQKLEKKVNFFAQKREKIAEKGKTVRCYT